VQAERFHLKGTKGLSQMLVRSTSINALDISGIQTSIPNLCLLPSGYTPARPAELLQSALAHTFFENLKQAPFEYVIIDAPPVLPVADAQIMASLVHAVILVVNAHKTPRRALVRAREELSKAHVAFLGVVVNKSRWPDYTRELEYPDDFEHMQGGDSAPLSSVHPPTSSSTSQAPQISARQKRDDLRQTPSIGNSAFHAKGQS
jgi:capsular exopolysaccharide synthesis family protein